MKYSKQSSFEMLNELLKSIFTFLEKITSSKGIIPFTIFSILISLIFAAILVLNKIFSDHRKTKIKIKETISEIKFLASYIYILILILLLIFQIFVGSRGYSPFDSETLNIMIKPKYIFYSIIMIFFSFVFGLNSLLNSSQEDKKTSYQETIELIKLFLSRKNKYEDAKDSKDTTLQDTTPDTKIYFFTIFIFIVVEIILFYYEFFFPAVIGAFFTFSLLSNYSKFKKAKFNNPFTKSFLISFPVFITAIFLSSKFEIPTQVAILMISITIYFIIDYITDYLIKNSGIISILKDPASLSEITAKTECYFEIINEGIIKPKIKIEYKNLSGIIKIPIISLANIYPIIQYNVENQRNLSFNIKNKLDYPLLYQLNDIFGTNIPSFLKINSIESAKLNGRKLTIELNQKLLSKPLSFLYEVSNITKGVLKFDQNI